jgi:hypothetical protein
MESIGHRHQYHRGQYPDGGPPHAVTVDGGRAAADEPGATGEGQAAGPPERGSGA